MITRATIIKPNSKIGDRKIIRIWINGGYVSATNAHSAKWTVGKSWAGVAHWYEKRGAAIKES